MPRASWNGFLRLSLVTCPVYLVPATTEAKRVRFNQLNGETGNRVALMATQLPFANVELELGSEARILGILGSQ